MNKKELFEAVIELPVDYSGSRPKIDKLTTLELIKLLDEPQKVVVPQFVADWIEKCKAKEKNLFNSLVYTTEGVNSWVDNSENQETFARAWLDGYEVEKEKRYMVKMKDLSECYNYLNYDSLDDEWYFNDAKNGSATGTHHTRKKLEDAGFGEVFNSPLFEVEEVEE
jgi:hypothetical protein